MRALIYPTVLLAAVVVSAATPARRGHADEGADAARIAIEIDDKLAKLNIRPKSAELTSEKAERVRQAIAQADYATASAVTKEVLAQSRIQNWRYYPFSDFIAKTSDLKDPNFEPHLNEWVSKNNNDAIPLLLRARYYFDLGWHVRGTGFASATSQSHLETFANYMEIADANVAAALKLNSDLPYAYYLRLLVLRGNGAGQKMTEAFDTAIAKYPNYYPLYDIMLQTLQPRWGGSAAEMGKFVDKYAGGAAKNSPLKLLYVDLYQYLLSTAGVNCRSGSANAAPSSSAVARLLVWLFGDDTDVPAGDRQPDCIGNEMAGFVTPQLEQNVQAALAIYDDSDKHQFDVAIGPLLSNMLREPSGGAYAGATLEWAATAMHTDSQLHEEEPGKNDYVIDEAVGLSWYQQGFNQNALTKYEEAVKDAASAAFPDEEERAVAIAPIYEQLAETAYKLGRYADAIAFDKAAMEVDGRHDDALWICASYYQLKNYDAAIDACTNTLNETDNINAHYWRGRAYQAVKKIDQAVQDFAAVTDSTSYFRTAAATELTTIYFTRHDVQSAMDVYTKHPYLFDGSKQRRADLAVSYNNRCYAYLKLGALQKALDDCSQSLKYGNIPDAFRKQQVLVKRLKAQ